MMKFLRIKKGHDLNLTGRPSKETVRIDSFQQVAVLPERIPFVKPRLVIREGEPVKIGTTLFTDKRNPDLKFLSPGGGIIKKIRFGPRRVIREIVIALDQKEEWERFESIGPTDLSAMERNKMVEAIMGGGLWCLFKEFPFGDVPHADTIPPSIIVTIDSKEPFQPLAEVYLENDLDLFEFGVSILNRLTKKVYLTSIFSDGASGQRLQGMLTHTISGPYPAGDPGVTLYRTKKSSDDNRAWHINGQDVLLLADLIKNGRFPIARTIVIAGDMVADPKHVITRMGAPLDRIVGELQDPNVRTRFVVGGVFRGYTSARDSYLGLYETSLMVLAVGDEKELFGFARPGFSKPSYSKTFLSRFNPAPVAMDCGLHGEERACINCGYCAEVCAVDILPQFTLKSTLAGEVEEALAHGLLDCVACGLCTYVCPSKIEICKTLKQAKEDYYRELT